MQMQTVEVHSAGLFAKPCASSYSDESMPEREINVVEHTLFILVYSVLSTTTSISQQI